MEESPPVPADLQPVQSEASNVGSATRARILDVAEALFSEFGLAGTSVRDIASEVGLTPASLYNHFEGKQALYEAVLERGIRPLIEQLRAGLSSGEIRIDSGHALIAGIMQEMGQRPHLPRLIHHAAVTGGDHLQDLTRQWIRPLFEQAVEGMEKAEIANWDRDEFPLLIAAWLNLIFGHFALAPLLSEVVGEDPLSEEGLARQTRFLQKLGGLLEP